MTQPATPPQSPGLREALAFYADLKNWQSPSSGFALQYDPETSPLQKDQGDKARHALAAQSPVLPPSGVEGTWKQSDEAIRNLIAKEIWRYQEYIDAYGPFNEVSVDSGDMKALAKQMAIDEADGIRKVILSSLVVRARIAALSASVAGEREYDPNVEPCNDAEFGMKP